MVTQKIYQAAIYVRLSKEEWRCCRCRESREQQHFQPEKFNQGFPEGQGGY